MADNPNRARRELIKSVTERTELDKRAVALIRDYQSHFECDENHIKDWAVNHLGEYIVRYYMGGNRG